MSTRPRPFVLSLALCAVTFAATTIAQETPQPSPELQKLQPLIGSWRGSGTAQMGPGEPSKWQSHNTYSWALDKFVVQEDAIVSFEGLPNPLVMRNYIGWDNEHQHFVQAGVDNDGHVAINRFEVVDDATFASLVESFQGGQTFFERHTVSITGEQMTFALDMMGAGLPPMRGAEGTMQRTDEPVSLTKHASPFTAVPGPMIRRLAKTAGTFAVKATMVMMPGMPAMNITGQDEVQVWFDGAIVHVHTTGTAEGSPEQYVGELFYGHDARHDCLSAVFVSNMGEIGLMSGTFAPDDKTLILTSAQRYMGQPTVQRMLMHLDANGAPTSAVGHTIVGTAPPYESWNATYTRK